MKDVPLELLESAIIGRNFEDAEKLIEMTEGKKVRVLGVDDPQNPLAKWVTLDIDDDADDEMEQAQMRG